MQIYGMNIIYIGNIIIVTIIIIAIIIVKININKNKINSHLLKMLIPVNSFFPSSFSLFSLSLVY